jgi:DNA mismatch repair protein MLH1
MLLTGRAGRSEELFYQLGLRQFANLPRLKLEPAPSLRALISLGVEAEEHWEKAGMSQTELVEVRRFPFWSQGFC